MDENRTYLHISEYNFKTYSFIFCSVLSVEYSLQNTIAEEGKKEKKEENISGKQE